MIVPKRKTSKQRKRTRRAHHSLKTVNLVNVDGESVHHRLVKFFKNKNSSKK